MKKDKEVVLAAVAQDGFAPMYADKRICGLLSQELQAYDFLIRAFSFHVFLFPEETLALLSEE